MTEGLFDRYFRLLAGQLPPQEYGVIAEPVDDVTPASVAGAGSMRSEWLC
jgi:hypothetical protein